MDLQQLIALQKASGGQNVITPDNAGRIMGLAAQQEANRQLAMDAGKLAVEERMRLQQMQQGMTPGQISGSTIVAPSGARFVTDAQGNVVGMNAAGTIPGPMPFPGETQADAQKAFNRGESTASERALFSGNFSGTQGDMGLLRRTFINEMQRRAPTQAVPVSEEAPPTAPTPPVVPPPANPPPNAAEIQKLQAEQRGMENMFGVNALPSEEQRGEDASRADLYRELQKVSRELDAGVQDIPGLIGPPGAINPKRTLTPEDLSNRQKRKAELEGKIRESGSRSSKRASAKAAPKDAMAHYQAILDSLARVSK